MTHYYDLDQLVTLSDIAKMYDVGPSAVANWAIRHADFPAPIKTWNLNVKLYDKKQIQRWYNNRR